MPNPNAVYNQLETAINAFVSDPNNQDLAAVNEERKRLAKEIRNMHLSYVTGGNIEAIPEDQRKVLEEKQKLLTEKDDKYWNAIKNNAGALFGQKPYTLEQLSLQMNHGAELDGFDHRLETNWTLKSPYSQKEQLERAKVRNDLLKKVFAEQIDRMRGAEQQQRLGAQMRLHEIEDNYIFGAAYSTVPGKPDLDIALAVESFSSLTESAEKSLSKDERDAYTQEFYNVYRKTFNQLHEKQIDLDLFSDMTQWKNPDGTWNDEKLVENYETISLLNKIGTASASMNEIASGLQIPPDKECERFCRTYDLQLSLSSALMERLDYIQNPYYDEIDLDDPQMKQSFTPVLSSPAGQAYKSDALKDLEKEDIFHIKEEKNLFSNYHSEKLRQLTALNSVSKAASGDIGDLFHSWVCSQYQGYKQNMRAIANVLRAQGRDLSQLRMSTDLEYWEAQLRDERDFEKGATKDKDHWRKKAGIQLQSLGAIPPKPENDRIIPSYWFAINAPSEYVTFISSDGKANEMKIPVSVMLNPDFAKDLNQRLKNEERSVPPREPAKGANAKEKEKYEYEKTLCDMEELYHGVLKEKKERFVQQGEKLKLFPNSLKDVLKKRDDSIHAIIQKHSEKEVIKLTDDSAPDKSKTIKFPPLPELCLRRVVYAQEVFEIKDRGRVTNKVTPETAEKAIKEAKLRIIEAVKLSENKNEVESPAVEKFIKEYGENSVTEAGRIIADYQKSQRSDPERAKKEEYLKLFNLSEDVFDELKAKSDELEGTKSTLNMFAIDLTVPLRVILNSAKEEEAPYYREGLQDLRERVEKGGTLVGFESELLDYWKRVKPYADKEKNNIPLSEKEQKVYNELKKEYDKKCVEIFNEGDANTSYVRYLSKVAKKTGHSVLDFIADADKAVAARLGKKYHLTPEEIEQSYQNCKNSNEYSRIKQVKKVENDISDWEKKHGLESGHIKALLDKDPSLKVDAAKAMVMKSLNISDEKTVVLDPKEVSAVKSYAKKLGVSADAMLNGLTDRKRDFPRYTAKFFYEDTKQDLDTAFKTFSMTQKEFFEYCQETNNDPLAFAKKASTGDMQLAFSAAIEEYGMSGKEFLEYCQETERDPFVLAQRTAAESLGEYKVLQQPKEEEVPKNIQNEENPKNIRNEEEPWNIQNEAVPKDAQKKWAVPSDALQAESDALEAKQKYEIDLEKKIKEQLSVDVFSDEMVANLKKLSAAAENDAKSLRGKVKKDSAAEVLLIRGKRFYNDVIAEVQTKAATGDKMSTAMENIAPLYMLTAHELLKEELKGKGKGTGIADYLSRFKGEDKAKGLNNLVATMAKIEVIKEPLNNMSAYDLWHSLKNGTFMKNLGIGAVQKLNNTLRQEAQPKPAGKQSIDENQVVQGNAPKGEFVL